MPYLYSLSRLLFAAIVAGTVGSPSPHTYIPLMVLSILMLVTLAVIRPYQ